MHLSWLAFRIDLCKMNQFLRAQVPNADGITADEEGFDVVEATPLTEESVAAINNYLDSLTEEEEAASLARPQAILSAIAATKNGMVLKLYHDLTVVEKKILLGIELTKSDEDSLLNPE